MCVGRSRIVAVKLPVVAQASNVLSLSTDFLHFGGWLYELHSSKELGSIDALGCVCMQVPATEQSPTRTHRKALEAAVARFVIVRYVACMSGLLLLHSPIILKLSGSCCCRSCNLIMCAVAEGHGYTTSGPCDRPAFFNKSCQTAKKQTFMFGNQPRESCYVERPEQRHHRNGSATDSVADRSVPMVAMHVP